MALVEGVLQDVRYGLRMLSGGRWSTAIVILSLAVGIGVNTAVFTAHKAFAGRPLDARNPSEMMNLALRDDLGSTQHLFSNREYQAYQDGVGAFRGMVAFRPTRVTVSNAGSVLDQRSSHTASGIGRLGLLPAGASNIEFAQVFIVSENYFSVLGISALYGSSFDSRTEASSVLISENYWQRRFGADPAILGKVIHLNGVPVTVIGITPRDFIGTSVAAPAYWLPMSIEPRINQDPQWLNRPNNRPYRLFGRLAPSATREQASTQLAQVANHVQRVSGEQTGPAKNFTAMVWPGSPFPLPLENYPGLQLAILLIMSAAAIVLMVAAANAGSLQLARARSRETELRTRLSLGASRLQVMRLLLAENALLGLLAGIVALILSTFLLKLGVKAFNDAMPVEYGAFVFDVSPDPLVFANAFLIALAAGLLTGLTPAIQGSRCSLIGTARAATTSRQGRRLQGILVVVQVGLSLILMITGTMFVRGAVNSLGLETGYASKEVVQLDIEFPKDASYTAARRSAVINEVRTGIAGLPGVTRVASGRPPGSFGYRTAAIPVNEGIDQPARKHSILHYTQVQPGYFETLGIRITAGRSFARGTLQGQYVVLSESAARELLGGGSPIGQRIRLGAIDEKSRAFREMVPDGAVYEVIGIAGDTRGSELDGSDSKQIYIPVADERLASRPVLARVQGDPLQFLGAMDRVIRDIDPRLMATHSTLHDALRRSPPFILSGLAAAIASSIGGLALLLALTGIFGTVSHIVALRTREVGIRIAVGAQKHHVLRLILAESTRPVVVGLVAGIAVSAGVVYLLRGILYGIRGIDSIYFGVVAACFLVVALAACYPPARRAMAVDPMVALRDE